MYRLAKQLQALGESEIRMLPKQTQLELIRSKIQNNLHTAYERGEKVYNTRVKKVKYIPGQEVCRRTSPKATFQKT